MSASPSDELDRLDALACCRIVGTPPEPEFDALVELAAQHTNSPLAMLVLVDAERIWVKSAFGMATGDYPRSGTACELAVQQEGLFELTELDQLAEHPLAAAVGARSYASVPLREQSRAIGTLAVLDTRARSLDSQQRRQLHMLARQASALLELRRLRGQRLLKAEALLSSATRISGVGCWQWNMVTGEVTWTDEMYVIFGLTRDVRPTLELFTAAVHPDDRGWIGARTELALRGETSDYPDYRIVRPNGDVRIVHASAEVERDAQGRPVTLTGALHDVTAQRKAEEQRKQLALTAMQHQKLESLGLLSAGMAHDFNNLLVGVLGNAELALTDRSLAPTTSDLLERIVEAAQRAGALTQQLLAYTGRSRISLLELDLSIQLSAQLGRLQTSLPSAVTLNATLPTGLPAIRADIDQIQLLTQNLVLNAAESYEQNGEVSLRLFAATLEHGQAHGLSMPTPLGAGDYVVLEVADRGCGMARDTLERAFEPFFSTKFTGRGLGLPAALGIARSHAGVLTVDSRPGEGTLVRVYFPALDRVAVARESSQPASTRAGQLSGYTVLLVDDERLVRNVERLAMQRAGLKVLEAEDGQQAIDMLARHRDQVDLIVLDLMMPGLDAASTLRGLRAERPDLPVLVQSGYPEEEAARSLAEVDGQLEFLQKPFTVQNMLSKVAALLRRE